MFFVPPPFRFTVFICLSNCLPPPLVPPPIFPPLRLSASTLPSVLSSSLLLSLTPPQSLTNFLAPLKANFQDSSATHSLRWKRGERRERVSHWEFSFFFSRVFKEGDKEEEQEGGRTGGVEDNRRRLLSPPLLCHQVVYSFISGSHPPEFKIHWKHKEQRLCLQSDLKRPFPLSTSFSPTEFWQVDSADRVRFIHPWICFLIPLCSLQILLFCPYFTFFEWQSEQ